MTHAIRTARRRFLRSMFTPAFARYRNLLYCEDNFAVNPGAPLGFPSWLMVCRVQVEQFDSELRFRLTSEPFPAGFPNPSHLRIHTFTRAGFPAGGQFLKSRGRHKREVF